MPAPVRRRDLQANLKQYGMEEGTARTLAALLDEYAEHRQHMRELTELVDKCIDHVDRMVYVGSEMYKRMEQIKRDREQGEQHDEHGAG